MSNSMSSGTATIRIDERLMKSDRYKQIKIENIKK